MENEIEEWVLNNINNLDRLYSLYLTNVNKERFFVSELKKRFKEFKKGKDIRLNILWGLRGTGKTTGILQFVKEIKDDKIFVFGDASDFVEPLEVVKIYHKLFPKKTLILIIDEVHEINEWDKKLKNIYDAYPNVFVVATGSSMIGMKSTRIARRAVYYNIKPLNFREYLYLKHDIFIPQTISKSIKKALTSEHPYENLMPAYLETKKFELYQYVDAFIKHGGFPLLNTPDDLYYQKVYDLIQRVVDHDIPKFSNFTTETLSKSSKILNVIATANDSRVSVTSLSQKFGISRPVIDEIFNMLASANLIVRVSAKGMKKSDKIYFSTPSLRCAINSHLNLSCDIGILREEVIISHLNNSSLNVYYIKKRGKEYDFLLNIDKKAIKIEVGGRSKSVYQLTEKGQIKGRSIIVSDTDTISYIGVPVVPMYLFLLI